MRKILLFVPFLLFSINSFSQVSVDRFDEDGSRVIISKQRWVGGVGFKWLVAFRLIDVIDVNDANTYYILLALTGNKKEKEYTKGRRILLKLNDDSIIELINQKSLSVDDYEGFTIQIKYLVNEDEIFKLINGEVKKLRIEDDFDYVDIKVKGNAFSKGLRKVYEAIQEEKKIEKKPNSTGLYDGF